MAVVGQNPTMSERIYLIGVHFIFLKAFEVGLKVWRLDEREGGGVGGVEGEKVVLSVFRFEQSCLLRTESSVCPFY